MEQKAFQEEGLDRIIRIIKENVNVSMFMNVDMYE